MVDGVDQQAVGGHALLEAEGIVPAVERLGPGPDFEQIEPGQLSRMSNGGRHGDAPWQQARAFLFSLAARSPEGNGDHQSHDTLSVGAENDKQGAFGQVRTR
jgi:hypothetical protein